MDSPLVARARERTELDAAVAPLAGGAGRLVVLRGEPGIGKSRLLAYLAEQAGAAGAAVLAARASEFEADLPYALFGEALGDRPGAGPAAGADRHRTHRALRDALARRAAARPLVLVPRRRPLGRSRVRGRAGRARPASAGRRVLSRSAPAPGRSRGARGGARRRDRRGTRARLDLAPLSEAEAAALVGRRRGGGVRARRGEPVLPRAARPRRRRRACRRGGRRCDPGAGRGRPGRGAGGAG